VKNNENVLQPLRSMRFHVAEWAARTMAVKFKSMSLWTDYTEIDISPLDVCGDQLHTNPVADINALEPLDQPPLNRHIEKPGPCAFGGSTSDDGIKLFSNSGFKKKRRGGFGDLPFDFVSGILFFCAMIRQNLQFIVAIGRRSCVQYYNRSYGE